MPNRTTFLAVVVPSFIVMVLLLRVAIREQLWLEFWLSSLQILACAASLLFLLRDDR